MTHLFDPEINRSAFSFFSEFSGMFSGQLTIELIVLALIALCGGLGNILVIATTILYKNMRTTSNVILSLQASSDLAVVCNVPFLMVVRVTGHWELGNAVCKIWMFIFQISQGTTTFSMCALAIERYFCICRSQNYNVIKRYQYVILVCISTSSIIVNIPFTMAWKTLTLEKDGDMYTFCGLQWPVWMDHRGYSISTLFILFCVPLLISAVLYTVIWLKVRKSTNRVANAIRTNSNHKSAHTKLLKMLILSVVLYTSMFMPFFVISSMLFYTENISSSLYLVMVALLVANTIVNPSLLFYLNVKYRACMREILTCRMYRNRKNGTHPAPPSTVVGNLQDGNSVKATTKDKESPQTHETSDLPITNGINETGQA